MTCVNNLHSKALQKLREDYLISEKKIQHLKQLYKAECANSSKVLKKLREVTKELEQLKNKYASMTSEKEIMPKKKIIRKRKHWDDLKNECTKRRRLAHYKDRILETLKNIEGCHRGDVQLWLNEERVKFTWSPKDFKKIEKMSPEMHVLNNISHDHSYVSNNDTINNIEEDEFEDLNYSEIYNCDGSWKRNHLQCLVHVLDSYRISHEAYHELRLVSKGHLPPIWRLVVEKNSMSDQIPYIKHPQVRTSYARTW